MKRYIRSAAEFGRGWNREDIEIYNSIDWAERDYEPFRVDDDTILETAYVYGLSGRNTNYPLTIPTRFVKFIRANPIYPPYYAPADETKVERIIHLNDPNASVVGPMFDGKYHNGNMVMTRYETEELYNVLSD